MEPEVALALPSEVGSKRNHEDVEDDLETMKKFLDHVAGELDLAQKNTLQQLCNERNKSVSPSVFYDLVQSYIGQNQFNLAVQDLKISASVLKKRKSRVYLKKKDASTKKVNQNKARGGGGNSGTLFASRSEMFKRKWLLPRSFVAMKQTSVAWDYFYKIGPTHPKYGETDKKGRKYNYQCCVVMDNDTETICGALYHFPITDYVKQYGHPKVEGGVTHDSNSGLKHLQRFHFISTTAPASQQTPNLRTVFDEQTKKLNEDRALISSKKKSRVDGSNKRYRMGLEREGKPRIGDQRTTAERAAQLEWYTYGNNVLSESTFNNDFTLKMLRTVRKTHASVYRSTFKQWLASEWDVFCDFVGKDFEDLLTFHSGNKFTQPLCFSTKVGNVNVLTTGIHFVRRAPEVSNVNIALGNIFSGGNSVSSLFTKNIDISNKSAVNNAVTEVIKKIPVLNRPDLEKHLDLVFDTENVISLHSNLSVDDRPLAYALGMLTRESCLTGGCENDAAFEGAFDLISKVNSLVTEVACDDEVTQQEFIRLALNFKFPLTQPEPLDNIDDFTFSFPDSDRLSAINSVILHACKFGPAYISFINKHVKEDSNSKESDSDANEDVFILSTERRERIKKLGFDENVLKSVYELEAVMYICELLSKFTPSESRLTAGLGLTLKKRIERDLNPEQAKLKVIDDSTLAFNEMTDTRTAKLMKRKEVSFNDCTDSGKKIWKRAYDIFKAMYSDDFSSRDIVATMLDVRTKDGKYLSQSEMKKGMGILQDVYVKYKVQREKFQRGSEDDKKEKENDVEKGDGTNWDDLLEEDGFVEAEPDEEKMTESAKKSFKGSVLKWLKAKIDWREEFPEAFSHLKVRNEEDAEEKEKTSVSAVEIDDLTDIDIGKIYQNMLRDTNSQFGELPEIALTYIGSRSAEQFNHRVLQAVQLIMPGGGELLTKEELSKVVCLRINGEYMEYMKEKFPDIASKRKRDLYL